MEGVAPVYYEGVHWRPAHAVFPGEPDTPQNIPLCPYCLDEGKEVEARPEYDRDLDTGEAYMKRDPVILCCFHPRHGDRPFQTAIPTERWTYATLHLERRPT